MTNKLIVIINSLKVSKIKKVLLHEMKFLVPKYSCLQKPWTGGCRPQILVLSVLCPKLNLMNPPPRTKFLGAPLSPLKEWIARHWLVFSSVDTRIGLYVPFIRRLQGLPSQCSACSVRGLVSERFFRSLQYLVSQRFYAEQDWCQWLFVQPTRIDARAFRFGDYSDWWQSGLYAEDRDWRLHFLFFLIGLIPQSSFACVICCSVFSPH